MIRHMRRRKKDVMSDDSGNFGGDAFGSSSRSLRPGSSQPSHVREATRKAAEGVPVPLLQEV